MIYFTRPRRYLKFSAGPTGHNNAAGSCQQNLEDTSRQRKADCTTGDILVILLRYFHKHSLYTLLQGINWRSQIVLHAWRNNEEYEIYRTQLCSAPFFVSLDLPDLSDGPGLYRALDAVLSSARVFSPSGIQGHDILWGRAMERGLNFRPWFFRFYCILIACLVALS